MTITRYGRQSGSKSIIIINILILIQLHYLLREIMDAVFFHFPAILTAKGLIELVYRFRFPFQELSPKKSASFSREIARGIIIRCGRERSVDRDLQG